MPEMSRMPMRYRTLAPWLVILSLLTFAASEAQAKKNKEPKKHELANAVLWSDPGDIRSRDLFYGIGGKKDQPEGAVTFDKEDMSGTSPKFDVRDSTGRKWRAKLGAEARPETVATRILWAVGYFANENYLVPDLKVEGLPAQLRRGKEFVTGDMVKAVRLQRNPDDIKKDGDWSWKNKALAGSRQFNGLRVMMALLSNWDLKDENNAVLVDEKEPARRMLEVSDVGASFGRAGKSYTDSITKSNPDAYHRTKFIKKTHTDYVDFNFPTHPPFLYIFNPFFFFHHFGNRWIGKHIPRADAKWIASLLAQLTPEQIRSAFRAGGYNDQDVEQYASTLEARIAELKKL